MRLDRQGTYDYSAAEACRIARNTFFEWLARGEGRGKQRRGERRYAEFAGAVRRARDDVVPDESTILRFRHLLEQHGLAHGIFDEN